MKIKLIFDKINFLNDVQDIPRAFAPYIEIDENSENFLQWNTTYANGIFSIKIESNCWDCHTAEISISDSDILEFKRLAKRFIKKTLYYYLSENLQIFLPYGSLTGVRPTKLFYELKKTQTHPLRYLEEEFSVTKQKANLIKHCVDNQVGWKNIEDKNIAIFVNIPFCPTRCNYCSFISTEVGRVKKELPTYVSCVVNELQTIKEIINEKELDVTSIYIGGGTPTSIGVDNLEKIVQELDDYDVEFTVEGGRPDTINEEMLDMLKRHNVNRISINPQTFQQQTLDAIGRNHSIEDIFSTYSLAKEKGFVINMDFIAMLKNEDFDMFKNSIDTAINLRPHNITIHTLSLKRGSVITLEGEKKEFFGLANKMVGYGQQKLMDSGYLPYYMYRQKNTADNLENVGYCLEGYQCKYNIDMMEESISVISAGAGAMSKKVIGSRIERQSQPKGFREYCDRIDLIIKNKREFFDFIY